MTAKGEDRMDTVVLTGLTPDEIVRYLLPFEGMVAEMILLDGSSFSGVLGAISRVGLVVEQWDHTAGGPAGNVFTMELDRLQRLVVP